MKNFLNIKKLFKLILSIIFISTSFLCNSYIAKADNIESKSLSNNTIKILTSYGGWNPTSFYQDFRFLDMGDGSVRLRPMQNNNFASPSDLPSSAVIEAPLTIKFIDNEGNVYWQKQFNALCLIKDLANEISNVKIRYGLDSIQIIPFGDTGSKKLAITGEVYSNLDNQNYGDVIRESTATRYQFRVEKDGLYAQYINQVRIPDKEYIIENVEDYSKVLDFDVIRNSIATSGYNPSSINQRFKLEYDNTHKAYKIKLINHNTLLSWESGSGNDVISYPEGPYSDQYWYLESTSSGNHRLVSAHNIYKVLNLDADGYNISVANRNNTLKQEFNLISISDLASPSQEHVYTINSKLDLNKVLDVNNDLTTNNVSIWYKTNGNNQKWILEFDSNKNAYKIISALDNNMVLAWNAYQDSTNVFTIPFANKSEHYWILEYAGNGYYFFANYKDTSKVLDLYNGGIDNGTNLQVFQRRSSNNNNQKFKLSISDF